MITVQDGERWHDAPVGHMGVGPCPRCLRDGKHRNCCSHQLPEALGYIVASFTFIDGTFVPIVTMGDQLNGQVVVIAAGQSARGRATRRARRGARRRRVLNTEENAMTKKDRIDFVKAGLKGYENLNDRSKQRTSREAWIAFKLGCTEKQAAKYIAEAEAAP